MAVNAQQMRIVVYPHPSLRRVAQPIQKIDQQVRDVAERMLALMHEARGVGLAAPQVDLPWRLFVTNPTGQPEDDHVYINPALRDPSSQTDLHEEGCLSIPGVNGQVMRPTQITITAQDLDGCAISETADDLHARIWQHEYDHLDGVLILDKMVPADKQLNRRQIKALEADFEKPRRARL